LQITADLSPGPPYEVGWGEKNYYVILTPPGGVKITFFYVFAPIEQGIRTGKSLNGIAGPKTSLLIDNERF
jgi:hypothetical protein